MPNGLSLMVEIFLAWLCDHTMERKDHLHIIISLVYLIPHFWSHLFLRELLQAILYSRAVCNQVMLCIVLLGSNVDPLYLCVLWARCTSWTKFNHLSTTVEIMSQNRAQGINFKHYLFKADSSSYKIWEWGYKTLSETLCSQLIYYDCRRH